MLFRSDGKLLATGDGYPFGIGRREAQIRLWSLSDGALVRQFTGHLRVTLRNGEIRDARQGYFRGGVEAPMSFDELANKFRANCVYGGLTQSQSKAILEKLSCLVRASRVDLQALRGL